LTGANVTAAPPVICNYTDLTRTGDFIYGLYNTSAGQSTGGYDGRYSVPSEWPQYAIDSDVTTKYFNFGSYGNYYTPVDDAGNNTGFFVVPSISHSTVARALLFATANDNPNRDPITVTLEGSQATDNATLQMGSSWTLIYSGSTGISPIVDPGRNTYVLQQFFPNKIRYASYRLLITSQRGIDWGVQYSEARILGYF
jgi:hypothetical protein